MMSRFIWLSLTSLLCLTCSLNATPLDVQIQHPLSNISIHPPDDQWRTLPPCNNEDVRHFSISIAEWLASASESLGIIERAFLPSPPRILTLNGWTMQGTESSCDRYSQLNESQCWQKCEQAAKCELVTFGTGKKTGFCCLHQLSEKTDNVRPVQARHWRLIYEEQPGLHRMEGQVYWGDKIRRFDVDQEEVCSLACLYNPDCNVAAYKKTRGVCFLMRNMDVPRNVWDSEYTTFFTEQQLKLLVS